MNSNQRKYLHRVAWAAPLMMALCFGWGFLAWWLLPRDISGLIGGLGGGLIGIVFARTLLK